MTTEAPHPSIPSGTLVGGWQCRATAPDALAGPDQLPAGDDPGWLAAAVPGTAAASLAAAGLPIAGRDFDGEDWWFRCRFPRPPGPGPWRLRFGGLATIVDVWLNSIPLLHSENMFLPHDVAVTMLAADNELVIRCAALSPRLGPRRPRPRWKVVRLRSQTLRWVRTSLLGRLTGWVPTPAPVGPWRDVELVAVNGTTLERKHIVARCDPDGAGGSVHVTLHFASVPLDGVIAQLEVGGHGCDLEITRTADGVEISGTIQLDEVQRWWPHTHGAQPRYPMLLRLGDEVVELGSVAFRDVVADRSEDGFRLLVNGVAVFCRGAYWTPLDSVSLNDDPAQLRHALLRYRDANLNMLRIGAETVYPSDDLLDLLDELGILLWQDCMFAFYDLPDTPEFLDSIRAELSANLGRLQGRGCVAVVSGGSEIEQQAAFVGIPAEQRRIGVLQTVVPEVVAQMLPGVAYVSSSPTGGVLPIQPRSGIAHYYGVGAYLRPLNDARRAGVRFAAECLAFATPPERATVDEACGGATRAGHHPAWKAAVHRDAGAAWDFEDVTAHYTRTLFGVEPADIRWTDPERGLDLARATVAHIHERTWAEWRRPASACAGALVFHYQDLAPGAGLGLVDALGRPKAPWWALRRACAPIAVLVTDEGLNGLDAHLINETSTDLTGILVVELFAGARATELTEQAIILKARSARTLDLTAMFDGFRDLSYAHLFGPPPHDVVGITLRSPAGEVLGQAVHLIGGPARPLDPDLGLTAEARPDQDGAWHLDIRTRRFAQWVTVDVPGYMPSDNWFHLLPGHTRNVQLTANSPAVETLNRSRSVVRAHNGGERCRVAIVDEPKVDSRAR